MQPDSPTESDFAPDNKLAEPDAVPTEPAEVLAEPDEVLAEIVQLAYLGLRMALGTAQPRRLIRKYAHACLENKLNFAKTWMARGPFPPMQTQGLDNLRQAVSMGKGVVIAACHVGQYHRIPFVLNDLDVPVTLLLDNENKAREEQELAGWTALYQGTLQRPMEYLNAELPTAPWRMSQALKQGRALFVYMDGGTGLKQTDPARTCVEVKFLRLRMQVRKGLAYVAGRAGAPIVPAICGHNAAGEPSVAFCAPCLLNDAESLDAFCLRALQYCYSILEEAVVRDPPCWEEWYHVHRWVVYPGAAGPLTPPQPSLEQRLQFDREHTEILNMPTGPVLFHTGTGVAIRANLTATSLLYAARRPVAAPDLASMIAGKQSEVEPALIVQQMETAGFLQRVG